MKTIMKSFAVLTILVAGFVSCSKTTSVVSPSEKSVSVRFSVAPTEVKTVFGEAKDGVYPVLWTANEQTAIFYNDQEGALVNAKSVTPVPSEDALSAELTASFTLDEKAVKHSFYAISPAVALNWRSNEDWNGDGMAEKKMVYANIPADQTPNPGSCDEKAQVIVAKAESAEIPSSVNLQFSHLSSYGKIETLALPEGASEIVGLKIVSNKRLSGEVFCDFEEQNIVYLNNGEGKGEQYIYLDTNNALRGTTLSNVFFATVPHDGDDKFGEGSWMKITVYTMTDTWVKTINFSAERTLAFTPGRISSFSVSATGFAKVPTAEELKPLLTTNSDGTQKVWVWDSTTKGHYGEGNSSTMSPDWWSVEPDEMSAYSMYDDELEFQEDGGYVLRANGYVYCNKDALSAMGHGGDKAKDIEYIQPDGQTWDIVIEGEVAYLQFSEKAFPSAIPVPDALGGKYRILTLAEDCLYLRLQTAADAWYYRFIPKQ